MPDDPLAPKFCLHVVFFVKYTTLYATAAGRGAGTRDFDIVPGAPDASILLYRMESTDPGIAMPELGRATVHKEGVALVRQWIESMPKSASAR